MDCNTYLQNLPSVATLKALCKGKAVLDWIICGHEFEVYHTYNKCAEEEYDGAEAQWGHGFEDEDGTSLTFYFVDNKACLIVPSQSDESSKEGDDRAFEKRIPKVFLPYYQKNFNNADIPFVIWSVDGQSWQCAEHFPIEEEVTKFNAITADPELYKDWASEFLGDESYVKDDMSAQTITDIYNGKPLTEAMVLSLVSKVHDWSDLEAELNEIPYRYEF
jgi:hypothetical protein